MRVMGQLQCGRTARSVVGGRSANTQLMSLQTELLPLPEKPTVCRMIHRRFSLEDDLRCVEIGAEL